MLHSVEEALCAYTTGHMVIIIDDETRENEGDLACAAAFTTPATIAFMAREGRGLICLALDPTIADRLDLPRMVAQNNSPFGTNFTGSIEAATGVTTGISAADRARLTPPARQMIWGALGISFPCGRRWAGCWCAPPKPRRRLTWRG